MTDERVTERTDGVTSERVVERTSPAVVERRSGGAGVLYALIGLTLVALVAFFLMNMQREQSARTDAISDAASSVAGSVDGAAEAVGEAARDAAGAVNPNN